MEEVVDLASQKLFAFVVCQLRTSLVLIVHLLILFHIQLLVS